MGRYYGRIVILVTATSAVDEACSSVNSFSGRITFRGGAT